MDVGRLVSRVVADYALLVPVPVSLSYFERRLRILIIDFKTGFTAAVAAVRGRNAMIATR